MASKNICTICKAAYERSLAAERVVDGVEQAAAGHDFVRLRNRDPDTREPGWCVV
eukprot:SAG22_NODE_15219_length_354_cov_0.725490_1_plen_54_part_10